MAWTFRRVGTGDFELLARWLSHPHVARWWNHEWSAEAVERDFGPSARGEEPNEDWLALLAGRPVGLVQRCLWTDYPEYLAEMAPVYPVPPGAVSIDYLIGEPGDVGRGLGTAMIAAFVARTWADLSESSCIVVPVARANRASWRALERAGFVPVAQGELEPDNPIDDGQHLVLRLDRSGGWTPRSTGG
ncbi:aminoglycoside N(6')-acetyltransferase [Actinoplanes ianthinogenes]|uniref:Lysine N-acyltransferase MbtK n=1 Tax=Actinoplanes ianthinogenes TaxID=122358 RepID=A0ABM7LP76_9ACTN|nr:GNAT family N-acetyltransferase [Actinoplanes ianthinogenes]BCJ41035.1 aminoglycoside N(6')-acetyltransferase [Actinoplanes ianthinogenes]GGR23356.1 aminoglycoside N(6')-acetyltransferase [Actinoplanes ianthinogenes]